MNKHDRAIEVIERLIESIKQSGEGTESERYMILALEVAISQLMIDEGQKEELSPRKAGAFYKNEFGKWVRVGQ